MSEESGDPKPSKLKLSSSKTQPDTPKSAPAADLAAGPDPTSAPLADASPAAAPKATSKQSSTPIPKATPPPLAKQPAPRVSNSTTKKVTKPVKNDPPAPEKDGPLGSILIIAALLFILAAAGGGIWFLLKSNEPESTDDATTTLEASPSNPVERAKATIATVPDRNLDSVLEAEATPDKSAASAPVAPVAPVAKPTQVTQVAKPTQVPQVTQPKSLKETVSQYLQNVHIGGIRSGPRARIMLDGENYNINDTVQTTTGLIFIGIRDQKLLFKDSNGIVYVKSF